MGGEGHDFRYWEILAIPHFIVLAALWLVAILATMVAFFVILFTRYFLGISPFIKGG